MQKLVLFEVIVKLLEVIVKLFEVIVKFFSLEDHFSGY